MSQQVTRRQFIRGAVLTAGVLVLPLPAWVGRDTPTMTTEIVWRVVTVVDVDGITATLTDGRRLEWTADDFGGPVSTIAGDFTVILPHPRGTTIRGVELTSDGRVLLSKTELSGTSSARVSEL